MRAIQKLTSGELLTKQVMTKMSLFDAVVSVNKFLHACIKEGCCLCA
jgi:hypothetical protein